MGKMETPMEEEKPIAEAVDGDSGVVFSKGDLKDKKERQEKDPEIWREQK